MDLKRYTYKDMLGMLMIRCRSLVRIGAYCCIGILSSCTLADVVYLRGGLVEIYPKDYASPPIMYHFYSASDTITCQDNGKGDFVGFLPKGDYRVIAVNTRASGVKFADMDRYDKAIVKADYTAGHPDNIYTIVIDEWMNVRERDTVRREPVPVLLTKRLELKFELKGEYENESIDAVEGVLFGLYPSVYLHDGTDVVQTPAAEVSFNTDSERKTQISLFGLRTGYRLVLNLIREGEIVETHDVTEYVINKLSIPILLPATSVTIELIKNKESGGIEIRVEVKEWIPEGEGDPEVIVV